MADDKDMLQKLYATYQETGDKIYRSAAEDIFFLRAENERLRLELDMTQATIRVPSQKDDVRTIERLREELVSALDEAARLREALKPFAYYADLIPDDIGDTASASGTVGDIRAAKAALEGK